MRTIQQVLTMTTKRPDLRSEAIGWSAEDPSKLKWGQPIGMTPGFGERYSYETPMHALADGWRLLAPPEEGERRVEDRADDGTPRELVYDETSWWFVREVERP